MPSVRSWHRSASFDSDSSKLNSGRESMSDLTRRDVLKAGVAATAVAAGGGLGLAQPPHGGTAFKRAPHEGGTLRPLPLREVLQGGRDKWDGWTKKSNASTGTERL